MGRKKQAEKSEEWACRAHPEERCWVPGDSEHSLGRFQESPESWPVLSRCPLPGLEGKLNWPIRIETETVAVMEVCPRTAQKEVGQSPAKADATSQDTRQECKGTGAQPGSAENLSWLDADLLGN